MTFTEAAALVLRLCGKPLHYKDITDLAIEKSLLSHVGKSPEVTMGSRLNALLKKSDKENPLQRVKPGVFALREWSEQKINEGLLDRRPPLECIDPVELEKALHEAAQLPNGEEDQEPQAAATHVPLNDVDVPEDDEEKHRAELSHGAQDLFAHEEDDDEPIFAPDEEEEAAATPGGEAGDAQDRASKRRRRRRRTRGRREEGDDTSDDLPTYTVSDADPEEAAVPVREEREPVAALAVDDEFEGAPLDSIRAIESALNDLEKGRNLVSPGAILDQMRRKQSREAGLGPSALMSLLARDNARAVSLGGTARFKIAGGKVGLSSWFADRRIEEARRAYQRALDNLKSAQVRALSEQLARMPQRALGDLVAMLLERMGAMEVRVVRRPGAHGSELHLAATLKLRGLETAWGSLPTAVVVRRDGRDIGRERVLELRGSLHHYGAAAHGWLMTTGQVLSGAREEATCAGATPVSLTGRGELAELLIEHGLLVQRTNIEMRTLDFDLIESLSGGQ